jgi:hypothetical protein
METKIKINSMVLALILCLTGSTLHAQNCYCLYENGRKVFGPNTRAKCANEQLKRALNETDTKDFRISGGDIPTAYEDARVLLNSLKGSSKQYSISLCPCEEQQIGIPNIKVTQPNNNRTDASHRGSEYNNPTDEALNNAVNEVVGTIVDGVIVSDKINREQIYLYNRQLRKNKAEKKEIEKLSKENREVLAKVEKEYNAEQNAKRALYLGEQIETLLQEEEKLTEDELANLEAKIAELEKIIAWQKEQIKLKQQELKQQEIRINFKTK